MALRHFPFFLILFVLAIQSCNSTSGEEKNTPTPKTDTTAIVPPKVEAEAPSTPQNEEGYIPVSWKTLAKMEFESRYNEQLSEMIDYPIFHEEVKALDKQLIEIEGYVIPFEETGNETIVILSAFPYSNCFFCGGAGPESVIDVQMKNSKHRFKKDDKSVFRGRLKLNDSDLDYLNYIMEEAEVYE